MTGRAIARRVIVGAVRVGSWHCCPACVTGLWLSFGLLALLCGSGCHRGLPVAAVGSTPPAARGTITGIVRGPEPAATVAGRSVEAIDLATGQTHTAVTAADGGFTLDVPSGRYRLDLHLRDGETLIQHPGTVDVDNGDVDAHIEFVFASVRVTRPRNRAYRLDNGLGSPIASLRTSSVREPVRTA